MSKIKLLFLLICSPFFHVVRMLVRLMPRDANSWVLGSWEGVKFADNTKYLFLYLTSEERKRINVCWITKRRDVYTELKGEDLPVEYLYSIKGIWRCLRAGIQFTTHGVYDISPVFTYGAKNIDLFHVTYPLKMMEYDAHNFIPRTIKEKIALLALKPFVFDKASLSVASSLLSQKIIKSALRLNEEQVYLTGNPRTDSFFMKKAYGPDERKIESICDFNKFKNVIYYMPTFRNKEDFSFFDFGFDVNALCSFLEKTNSLLIFRFHPFDLKKIVSLSNIKHPNIIFEQHSLSDPYPLLQKATVLITDYSSVYADYLVLNRPIIFANFDHEGYISSERSLYNPYEEVTPGHKVDTWPKLIRALELLIVEKDDVYEVEREKLKNNLYMHMDGKSSKRLVDKLTSKK